MQILRYEKQNIPTSTDALYPLIRSVSELLNNFLWNFFYNVSKYKNNTYGNFN